jgi:uncharacterized membrane protein
MKLHIIFLLLTAVGLISTQNPMEEIENNLINAIIEITMFIDNKVQNKVFNIISAKDQQFLDNHEKIQLIIIKEMTKFTSIRILGDDKGLAKRFHKRKTLILVDNLAAFQRIQSFIVPRNYRSYGFHFFVLLNGNSSDLHEIFDMMWKKRIHSIFGLIRDESDDGVLFMTIDPFANPKKCGDTTPKMLNKFIDGSFVEKLQIKEKFGNLNLCPIRVSAFNENVAAFKQIQSNGSAVICGHEINMIKTVSAALNFTLDLDFRDGESAFGMVYDNGTATGVLGDTMAGRSDIALGDFYLKSSRMNFLDISESYLNYPIVFLIHKGEKFTALEKMLQPFSPTVWIFLLITFSIGVCVILMINYRFKKLRAFVYGEKVTSPMMNMLVVIIGSQQRKLPKRNFARFILMLFIIMCLVMRSIYQGSLFKFLQSDGRHKEIQSIQELVDKNFMVLLHEVNLDLIKEYPELFALGIQVNHSTISQSIDQLMSVSDKVAMFASEVTFIEYSRDHRTFPYTIFSENYISMSVVMYYRRDFYLREAIDSKLQLIMSSGLLQYWLKEFDHRDEWKEEKVKTKVLTMDHLVGVFGLLLIGHLVSIFAFIAEAILHKCEQFEYIV